MVLEVLAVILGIFYTIRKLDAVSRSPEKFPHVRREEFLAWQSRERAVYHLAMMASALKLVLGLSFQYLAAPQLPGKLVQVVGGTIDIAWLLVVLRTWWAGSGLRKERMRLGIWLGAVQAAEGEDALDRDSEA